MDKLLKSLYPILLIAITFICGISSQEPSISTNPSDEVSMEIPSHVHLALKTDACLYFPSQTQGAYLFRVPGNTHPTKPAHGNPFGLIKTKKMNPTGIRHFIDKSSLIIHSSFIRPTQLLIRLSKLLI